MTRGRDGFSFSSRRRVRHERVVRDGARFRRSPGAVAAGLALLWLPACTTPKPVAVSAPIPSSVQRRVDVGNRTIVLGVQRAPGKAPRILLRRGDRYTSIAPGGLTQDSDLEDAALARGRLWIVTGDCIMGRGDVFYSDNMGADWTHRNAPLSANCSAGSRLRLIPTSRSQAEFLATYASAQTMTIFSTDNAGESWRQTGVRCGGDYASTNCG